MLPYPAAYTQVFAVRSAYFTLFGQRKSFWVELFEMAAIVFVKHPHFKTMSQSCCEAKLVLNIKLSLESSFHS